MGLLQEGTVTQWVLLCLSQFWFCHGTVCPTPDFVMGLLQEGTVTQWVLPCLSKSRFCHGTATRRDCDTVRRCYDCFSTNHKESLQGGLKTWKICKYAYVHFRAFQVLRVSPWNIRNGSFNKSFTCCCLSPNFGVSWRCHGKSVNMRTFSGFSGSAGITMKYTQQKF